MTTACSHLNIASTSATVALSGVPVHAPQTATTKAAVEEGIVAGGGVALLRASAVLDQLRVTGEEQVGVNIIRRAMKNRCDGLRPTPVTRARSWCSG